MKHRGWLAAATVVLLVLPAGALAGSRQAGPAGSRFDPARLAGVIPQPMLNAYLDAANRWQVDWALLAAIGKLECDHGRARTAGCWPPGTVNSAGARGPMQFLGSTWRTSASRHAVEVAGPPAADGHGYATDGDGDGIADPWDVYDAVHAAARYLVDLHAAGDPLAAARAYNAGPANPDPAAGAAYATRAIGLAAHYHRLAGNGGPGSPPTTAGGFALPFDPAGLRAATIDRRPPRPLEWQLVKPHHGGTVAADIPLPVGTRLYALTAATVAWAGTMARCGNTVILQATATGARITYCHLATLGVSAGQTLTAGQPLGRSGGAPGAPGAGNSTGPHLHLQIAVAGTPRCPQALLLGLWRAWPVPSLTGLATGCTYTGRAPTPTLPVPIPPDLPIPTSAAR